MTSIPTDQQLIKEIRSIGKTAPHLMVCANCANYNMATKECSVSHFTFMPFVRGCNGNFFVTNEELLLHKVKNELNAQARDLDAVEAMLSMVITTACSASCFAEDLERRVQKLRMTEEDKKRRSDLRKDLDLTEEIKNALDKIDEIASGMMEKLAEGLAEIDVQYKHYIEANINRLFKEGKKFNAKKSDANLNNAMTICNLDGKFVQKCIGNKDNFDAVFQMLDGLKNDTPYPLGDNDWKHYKLKEYEYD